MNVPTMNSIALTANDHHEGSDFNESRHDSTTNFADESDPEDVKPTIGATENKRVIYSRVFVGIVLVVCAALAATLAYVASRSEEESTFEIEFESIASEIIRVAKKKEDNLVTIMNDFGTMVTSSALATGQTWPNVTIPDWERRANASQSVSGGRFLGVTLAVPPTDDSRAAWNQYADENIGWLEESAKVANVTPAPVLPQMVSSNPDHVPGDEDSPVAIPSFGDQLHLVLWQVSPPPTTNSLIIKADFRDPFTARWNYMRDTGRTARSPMTNLSWFIEQSPDDIMNLYYQPLYDTFDGNRTLVAFLQMALRWQDHFEDLLYEGREGIMVIVDNTCNQTASFEINGPKVVFLGEGDKHEEQWDHLGMSAGLTVAKNDILEGSTVSAQGISCGYSITVYPSSKFHDEYTTNMPVVYTCVVLAIFLFTSLVFVVYDCLVQRRQDTVMDSALKTSAIVDSLYPAQFRDQLLHAKSSIRSSTKSDSFNVNSARSSLATFVAGEPELGDENELFLSKPVADFFPEATVLFADIVGFTSWSSMREPHQVFILLESIYRAFDKIAKRRQVFAVEAVGDEYLAVAGVPVPMPNHAIVMCRFARDASLALPHVVNRLEKVLGPGTRDITMRFGIHSGPCTGGILRNERSRFGIFGDTVNTGKRMESSSSAGRIHLSESTAALIRAAGKEAWLEARQDKVHLKGKGFMQTYWLTSSSRAGSIAGTETTDSLNGDDWVGAKRPTNGPRLDDHTQRLVEWNAENLLRLLRQIVASRSLSCGTQKKQSSVTKLLHAVGEGGPSTLDEVAEVIALPSFCHKTAGKGTVDADTIDLGPKVRRQLYSYVSWVAQSYNSNPFHNLQHASHVCMSVAKLLSRIVAPEMEIDSSAGDNDLHAKVAAQLHDHTYGITSDPMTQFAIALSALVHDLDHRGVPNGQLVREDAHLAKLYDQSVAEQNSVDLAWAKLMSDEFQDLRACIYSNEDELKRFRQVVVNVVLATDIFDKQLKELRNARWDKAFQNDNSTSSIFDTADEVETNRRRRATIVLEHIIQASDVAHTMQHWHVYTTWNERLFHEMYLAYANGRAEKDPSVGWYKGELWFFDCYVIPLAKKLKECGVFGVSSDEYLNYAQNNRMEWAAKGEAIVAEMVKKYSSSCLMKPDVTTKEPEGSETLKAFGMSATDIEV